MKLKNLELKKNRGIYCLVLLSGILICGLYVEYYTYIFLLTILILPIISYFIPWILLKRNPIQIETKLRNTLPGEQNQIQMNYRLPMFEKLEIEYFISQPFSRMHDHEIKELLEQNLDIVVANCGKVDFRLHQLKTYDLLHLFYIKKKIDESYSYYVYPKIVPVHDWMEHFQHRTVYEKGDDLTEIYELRNYQQSDPMKAIHWKLSTKKGTLITKVGSKTEGLGLTLYLSLSSSPKENDVTLSLFHSFALELLKEYSFTIAYLENGEIKMVDIYQKDQYMEELEHILSLPLALASEEMLIEPHNYLIKEGGIRYVE